MPLTREEAAALIAREMPGYRLAPPASRGGALSMDAGPSADRTRRDGPPIDTGASLAQLRRKFLGASDAVEAGVSDAAADDDGFGPESESVTTVRIEPVDGGPSKTADIRDGKIIIVQG